MIRCRLAFASVAAGLVTCLGFGAAAKDKEPFDPFAPPAWVRAASRPSAAPASRPATRPIDAVDHVVIISVDGGRPDLLLTGDAPNFRALYRGGAYTFWARTTPNSITLPSHTSMLTGVTPRKHGIEWNKDLPLFRPVYPAFPTLFHQAKRHGYTTAMAAAKSKFDTLAVPGTLDFASLPELSLTKPERNPKATEVAREAAKILVSGKPNLLCVHLADADDAGHKYGWGSPEQAAAITVADRAIGRVLEAIAEAGLEDRTVVIVTADHGGAGRNHGPDDARCRQIPWVAFGPGVRKGVDSRGFDLTTDAELEVRTEDTFATACWLLGIPLERNIDGRPVTAAFDLPKAKGGDELLKDTAPAAPGTATSDAGK